MRWAFHLPVDEIIAMGQSVVAEHRQRVEIRVHHHRRRSTCSSGRRSAIVGGLIYKPLSPILHGKRKLAQSVTEQEKPVCRSVIPITLAETKALGEALSAQLSRGTWCCLQGNLGAGKSELARGVARGLGVTGHVPSPSFTILQTYEDGRLPLYHFDWYRIASAEELYELSLDEYLYGDGVSVIEWPDMAREAVPKTHLDVSIRITGETDRQFSIEPVGGFHALDYAELEATP